MHASYHNHTTWSDGKGTMAETIAAARDQGLDEVGISDHLILRPDGSIHPCGIDLDRIDDYFDELEKHADASRSADGPIVRVGAEVDWFPGARERIEATLANRALDVVVGSVHEVDEFIIDGVSVVWDRIDQDERNAMHRAYWERTADMAQSGLFDLAAHLDLPRKYGHYATIDLTAEIDAALDAIAEAGMVVELNTAGWHKPCRDAYPGEAILHCCRARDIPVTLSADAHDPAHLSRDFDRGAALLRSVGYDTLTRFDGRERVPVRM